MWGTGLQLQADAGAAKERPAASKTNGMAAWPLIWAGRVYPADGNKAGVHLRSASCRPVGR
jgi:hypothetical protein